MPILMWWSVVECHGDYRGEWNGKRMASLGLRPQAAPRFVSVPRWRNGRRGGLKIRYPRGCVGSSPSLGTTVSICSEVQFQLVSIKPGKMLYTRVLLDKCWTNSQHTAARHRFLQQESALTSKDFEQAVPPPDGFSAFGPGRGRDRPGIPTFQGAFPFQHVAGNMLGRHVWVEWDPPLSRRRALENRTLVHSQLGFGMCLRKGSIELCWLVGNVDGGGGSDGQGQIRGAAGTGSTGRTPATGPGWQKLGPSDR